MAETLVLVPCKAFARGKSRLAPVLAPAERAALCERFLRDTLDRLAAVRPRLSVLVLTSDARAAVIARAAGVAVMDDDGLDLNATLRLACERIASAPARILVMPTDLPLTTAAAIERFLAHDEDMAIAPDRAGSGTNLLALGGAARRDFPFAYGPGSFDAHCAAAAASGLTLRVARDPGLALDIDTPADLAAWRAAAKKETA